MRLPGPGEAYSLIGFTPVDVRGWAEVSIMEAPRRDGAVYGEEYSGEDGLRIAAALGTDPHDAARLARELRVRSYLTRP